MKKIASLIIISIIAFSLVSCNNNSHSVKNKPASFNEIISALYRIGYDGGEPLMPESDIKEMKADVNNLNSVDSKIMMREMHYDDMDITDQCAVIFLEFSDQDSAVQFYNQMLDILDSRPTEKKGDGYSKAVAKDSSYGNTYIISRVDTTIVILQNDYDDYCDAKITYDNKPELVLAEMGY